MFKKFLIVASLMGLVLAGCSSTSTKPEDGAAVEDRTTTGTQGSGTEGASTTGLPGGTAFQGNPLDNPASPLSVRTFYFDFDSSEIKAEDQESILAHGRYLAENADMMVSLEGHTDERGSREYNIGLGEQRAQAVRRMLLFQGATDRQVEVISFGEEKPVADGHDEMSYSQNRRVEIVYKR